jgi:glycosyltransferase involved in cell wall biosynthesis
MGRRVYALADVVAFLATIARVRSRGGTVVWTVHNAVPHDLRHPRLVTFLCRSVSRLVSGFISLSHEGTRVALARYPALSRKRGFVIPHGHFREAYPRDVTADAARHTLGIAANARVILFFGLIRDYKNVPLLIETFRTLDDPNVVLLLAGAIRHDALRRAIVNAAADDRRIRLHDEWIAAERVQLFFGTSDLVVLPFREVLNSGSAILGLSFDRPVLVPDLGSMGELQRSVGDAWVRTYQPPLDPSGLRGGLEWAVRRPHEAAAPLQAFEWPAIARATHQAYDTLRRR